uniref:Rab-GAP TBC domain-containing protein n=1 Tax=Acrobeloides nanus TaxID=290746 RepID=A0A914EHK6_9BILA
MKTSNLAELAARTKSEDCVSPKQDNIHSPPFRKGHFRRSSYESAKIQLDHIKYSGRRGPLYVGRVNSLNSCDLNEAARSTQTVVTFNLDRDRDRECSTSFASIETVPTMDSGLGSVCSKRSSLDRRSQTSNSHFECCSTSDFDSHSSPRLCDDAGFVEEEEEDVELHSRNRDSKLKPNNQQDQSKRRIVLPALNIAKTLFSRNRQSEITSKLWRPNNRIFKESNCISTTGLIFENRPSNLPAKSEEEAAKHRALYQELIEQAKKKEAKEAKEQKRLRELQRKMEDQVAASCKIWVEQILPKWAEIKTSKKCKELWWQGIPSLVRGKVWSLVIGNDLNLTPDLYEICCNRAKMKLEEINKMRAERSISNPIGGAPPSPTNRENTIDSIQLDVGRTFPHLGIFQEGGPYYDLLINLLGAYVCYRPDIGYVQSMSFIAAVLLLQMDPYPAFVAFANLLNRPLQVSFFRLKKPQMTAYFIAFDQFFEQELPELYAHFDAHDVRSDIYLIEWIYTMFAKSLPLDVTCRIWDVYLRDDEDFIFKTAIGILRTFEQHLLSLEFDEIVHFLCHIPDSLTSVELFANIEPLMKPYINTGETAKCKRSFVQILAEVNERVHPYHHLYATEGISMLTLDPNLCTNGLSSSNSTSSGLSTSTHTSISGIKISRSLSFFLRDMLKSPPAASSEQSFTLKKENGMPMSSSSCNLSN